MRRALLYSAFMNIQQPEGFTYLRSLIIPSGTHVILPINDTDKITLNGSYLTASNTPFVANGLTDNVGVRYVSKILNNSTLEVDLFLPCISNEVGHVGEAALYSETRDEFYYGEENQLIAGDPYTKLDDITFEHTVRYNFTNLLYNVHDINVYIKSKIPNNLQSTYYAYNIVSNSNTILENIYMHYSSSQNKNYYTMQTRISDSTTSSSSSKVLSINSEFIVDRINGVLKYNENIVWNLPDTSYNPMAYEIQVDLVAGCTYENIKCINTLQNNNNLFIYLVPAKINNKVGLYDICNDIFIADE